MVAGDVGPEAGPGPHGAPRRHGLGLVLGRERLEGLVVEDVPRGQIGGLADRDTARGRSGLKASGSVHDVAGRHPLPELRTGAQHDNRLARVDADTDGEVRSAVLVRLLDRIEDPQAGADRPFGVVLVGCGRAEHGHDGIPDELLDGPAKGLDVLAEQLEVGVHQRVDVLGVGVVRPRGKADDVAEEDGDDLPLLGRMSGLGLDPGAACIAVLRSLRVLVPTGSAREHGRSLCPAHGRAQPAQTRRTRPR